MTPVLRGSPTHEAHRNDPLVRRRRLFLAVLWQGVEDVNTAARCRRTGKRMPEGLCPIRLRRWLEYGDPMHRRLCSFQFLCDLAGIDVERARAELLERLLGEDYVPHAYAGRLFRHGYAGRVAR